MSNMSIVLHQFHSLVRLLISKPLAIGRGFRDWMAALAPEAGSEDEWSVFSSMKYVFSHSGGSTNYEFVECIICICLHHVSKLWPVEMWSHCCLGIESLESRKSKGSLNPCADCSDCFLEEAKLPLDWKTLDNKYFRQLGLPRCSCFGFIFPSSQRSDLRFKCSNWISNTNGLNGWIDTNWMAWKSERVSETPAAPRKLLGARLELQALSWTRVVNVETCEVLRSTLGIVNLRIVSTVYLYGLFMFLQLFIKPKTHQTKIVKNDTLCIYKTYPW